jgi:PAS domain S-box-containing protein
VHHRDRELPDVIPGPPAPEGSVVAEGLQPAPQAVVPAAHASSALLWRDVLHAVPGGVLLLNGDYVCTFASDGVRKIFGVDPGSLIGMRPDALVDADALPQVWAGRAAVAAGERAVINQLHVGGADGTNRWVESTSSRVVDPESRAACTAVHIREVTTEVETRAALTRLADRYRAVLTLVDEAVVQLDAQGRIESFNAQAQRLLHRGARELLGAHGVGLLDLRDQDGRPLTGPMSLAVASLAGDGTRGVWRSILRGDGRRRLVRVKLTEFEGPRPDGGGFLLVLREAGESEGAASPAPSLHQARRAAGLTAREGDVLDGLADGGDVPTIARNLGISVHSVRGHVKSITAKLGVHSQLQAVIAAVQRGMVDLVGRGELPG